MTPPEQKELDALKHRYDVLERRYDAACLAIYAYYHSLDTTDVGQGIADALADCAVAHPEKAGT